VQSFPSGRHDAGKADRQGSSHFRGLAGIPDFFFTLFMAPLYHRCPYARGYADDGIVKVSGPLPEDNIGRIQDMLRAIREWCTSNEPELDMDQKPELLHITRKRTGQTPGIIVPNRSRISLVINGAVCRYSS
jgi:hypothetical protein